MKHPGTSDKRETRMEEVGIYVNGLLRGMHGGNNVELKVEVEDVAGN